MPKPAVQIPLFPLHTVLSPGLALPIHVFEERYRAMVRHCLDTSSPFGVVLIREGSEVAPRDGSVAELAIAGVGTFAEIREASRYSDGRWELLTVGVGRFTVRDVHVGLQPYLVGEVEALEDEVGDPEATDALVRRVTRRFVEYLALLRPRDGEPVEPVDIQVEVDVADEEGGGSGGAAEAFGLGELEIDAADAAGRGPAELAAAIRVPDDPSQLSFLLAGIVQVEPHRKQALLEAACAEDRLREIDALLDRELLLLRRRLLPFNPTHRIGSRAN